MNWNRVKGHWLAFKGRCREWWGVLNDDDDEVIRGHREQLAGRILQRLRPTRDSAEGTAGRHRHFAGERWTE